MIGLLAYFGGNVDRSDYLACTRSHSSRDGSEKECWQGFGTSRVKCMTIGNRETG